VSNRAVYMKPAVFGKMAREVNRLSGSGRLWDLHNVKGRHIPTPRLHPEEGEPSYMVRGRM
jgi:hypothetical protein